MDSINVPKLSFDLEDEFVAARVKRALTENFTGEIVDEFRLIHVTATNGKEYTVQINGSKALCNCPDFTKRGLQAAKPCKHILAVKLDALDKPAPAEKPSPDRAQEAEAEMASDYIKESGKDEQH